MSVIGSNILAGASGQGGEYTLARSLRFRSSASAKLSRTPASTGSQTTWTYSFWLKMGYLGTANAQNLIMCRPAGNQYTTVYLAQVSGVYALHIDHYNGSQVGLLKSANQFRDPSAWYHIVCVFDTTNATSSDRLRMYVNGNRITSFTDSPVYPAQNTTGFINTTGSHNISSDPTYGGSFIDGYLTEVNFIDGQALTPSSFGETNSKTGVWQPKRYSGTYGTNGFYLPFTDNSALTTSSNAGLGKDFSGNGNYWNTNNISITSGSTYDSMTDVPTLTSATASNFATLNPISNPNGTIVTYSDGNLAFSHSASSGNAPKMTVQSTMALPAGKTYWEYTVGATVNDQVGIGTMLVVGGSADGTAGARYLNNGTFQSSYTNPSTAASYTTNDVIGMAYDQPNGTLAFYKNNSLQGTITNISTSEVFFAHRSVNSSGTGGAGVFNFGQRPFGYTPPTGYVALNTYNLPTPTIGATASSQANKYFDATLYTGTGSAQSIVNAGGFQPALVWAKSRSNAYPNVLSNLVVGATKYLVSNNTDAETTDAGYISAINSNGFSVGTSGGLNVNGGTFVGWQWAGNGSGSSNTAGSITSTVSANTTSGFSVVTYTGNGSSSATVGHGLGVTPSMVIVKQRSSTNDWWVKHSSLGSNLMLILNTTDATYNGTLGGGGGIGNLTSSSTFGFVQGTSNVNNVNANGGTYVAYCFAEVAGFSKFGSYTGNGSTDGVFVYTGFKPRYILLRRSNAIANWLVYDTARATFNVSNNILLPDSNSSELTAADYNIDILSNGFKLRTSQGGLNGGTDNMIYACFAENPFKYSLAR